MLDEEIISVAGLLIERLKAHGLWMTTAESCTGGLISGALTAIAGSSDVFGVGFVTYANQAKIDCLGVSPLSLEKDGAVSEAVAFEMVHGALEMSGADIALAVTGIAGPGGGSLEKPVGLVYIAAARRDGPAKIDRHEFGDIGRDQVRRETVLNALKLGLGLF